MEMMATMELEGLSEKECLDLLRETSVGRIAFVVDDFPVALPVNYRVLEQGERIYILLRTEPGNVIDEAPLRVAFQIDGVDYYRRGGWSVLVRGTMRHLDSGEIAAVSAASDPDPWVTHARDSWLVVEPLSMSGRRLGAAELEWAFHLRAYL